MVDRLKRRLFYEVIIVTLVLVGITSTLTVLSGVPIIGRYHPLIFAILFLYAPVVVLQKRGWEVDFLDKTLTGYMRSLAVFAVASIIVFPIFILAAHGWEKIVYGASANRFGLFPDFWKITAYQFVMVALPEEFFFRGYMQGTFSKIFAPKWKILGVKLGWGWVLTAFIFAVAHSLVTIQWWHFAIFFPALLFGYLKERTGTITAPVLFHGLANLVMNWVAYVYS